MKTWISFAMLVAVSADAEVIDRIAVSVGNRVITLSDLERQIRVVAFQNAAVPDMSSDSKRKTAEAMIQQKLIQLELDNGRYPQPTSADIAPAIDKFKKEHFADDAAFQRSLADYKITEQDLVAVLLWERTLLSFLELRFETGVQVTEQEVADYTQKTQLPAAQAEKMLISSRADQQAEQWLAEARRRTDVVEHEEAFR